MIKFLEAETNQILFFFFSNQLEVETYPYLFRTEILRWRILLFKTYHRTPKSITHGSDFEGTTLRNTHTYFAQKSHGGRSSSSTWMFDSLALCLLIFLFSLVFAPSVLAQGVFWFPAYMGFQLVIRASTIDSLNHLLRQILRRNWKNTTPTMLSIHLLKQGDLQELLNPERKDFQWLPII